MSDFGIEIKRMREERNWSQRDLARESGVSNAAISDIENGKTDVPSFFVVKKLADGLKANRLDMLKIAGYNDMSGQLARSMEQLQPSDLKIITDDDHDRMLMEAELLMRRVADRLGVPYLELLERMKNDTEIQLLLPELRNRQRNSQAAEPSVGYNVNHDKSA